MKKRMLLKSALVLLLAVCMLAPACSAFADASLIMGEGNVNEEALLERLRVITDFKFRLHEEGIGFGVCPVYSAPSEYAYRGANGRASCNTDLKMGEAGWDASGWLMVRYETSAGNYRVGYIPPRYLRGYKTTMPTPKYDYIPATAAGPIYVSDSLSTSSYYARLDEGEPFRILGKFTYSGSWWLIEFTVEGQISRGFISREESSFYLGSEGTGGVGTTVYSMANLGYPTTSPRGTAQIGIVRPHEGERKLVRQQPDISSKQITVAYHGKEYACYDAGPGSGKIDWYYIFVESDSIWGWIASGNADLVRE